MYRYIYIYMYRYIHMYIYVLRRTRTRHDVSKLAHIRPIVFTGTGLEWSTDVHLNV